jgi:glycosyltransferase involved in cell wall biosynthesis
MQADARKTIVFIESAAAMGGVQFSTLYLVESLNKAEWKPIVVCPEEGDLTRACREAGVEVHVLAQPRLRSTSVRTGRSSRSARLPNLFAWLWNAYLMTVIVSRLRTLLSQAAPDLIVTKGLSSHFSGGWAARKLGIPCVWHVQDLISERNFGIYRRAFALAARLLPQQIIADGLAIKHQLPAAVRRRTAVVHNGVDTNVFRPGLDGSGVRQELGIAKDHLVVGHAGRITPWKGQHYLIEAFARIAADHPNVSLLLAGSPVFDNDAYERKLLGLTAQLGLQDRIKFAGYRHDLPGVLAAMDVFAFTSVEKDTSPLALLSALSCGLPIAAFNIEGVAELVKNDECLLSPVAGIEELAASLKMLLGNADLRRRLGAKARKLAVEKLSLSLYTSRMQQIFMDLIGGARQRSNDGEVAEARRPSIGSEAFDS